jgi:predicted membrane-bound mannosyltransferase
MGKLTGKLVKGVLNAFGKEEGKASKFISEEMNAGHEDMIKAMRAKKAQEIPNTRDVESIVAPQKAAEDVAPEVDPRFENMSEAERQKMLEYYKRPTEMFPEGIKPDVKPAKEPWQPKVDLPEGEDEAINTIMDLIKSSKNKKAKK